MRKLPKTLKPPNGKLFSEREPEPYDVAKNTVLYVRAVRVSGPDKNGWMTCQPLTFKGDAEGDTFKVQTKHVLGGPLK